MKPASKRERAMKNMNKLLKVATQVFKIKADSENANKKCDKFVKMIETLDAKIAEADGEIEEARAVYEQAIPLLLRKEALVKLLNASKKGRLLLVKKKEVVEKHIEALDQLCRGLEEE